MALLRTVLLMVHVPVLGLCIGIFYQTLYQYESGFDHQQCTSENGTWQFPDVRSRSTCLSSCSRTLGCVSVFYNNVNSTCLGVDLEPSTMVACSENFGSILYTKAGEYLNGTCVSDVDCLTFDAECRNETCQCIIGYSIDPGEQTCVENCTEYGYTYQKYSGLVMTGDYLEFQENGTLADCFTLCETTTNGTCRGISYSYVDTYAFSECYAEFLAPFAGSYYFGGGDMSYYMRNCA